MEIVVICAMQKELNLLLEILEDNREFKIDALTVYKGRIDKHTVYACQCGIGKVNSALCTLTLIEKIHPDLVINTGVAGGVAETVHIGTVMVADKVAYDDVWCGPGTTFGKADGCPLFFEPYVPGLEAIENLNDKKEFRITKGLLCSGDKFITTPEEIDEIRSHFPDALGCDMESTSIAQTCYLKNVPFLIIRIMSDRPGGGENISEYTNFWNEAPSRTFEVVKSLISYL